MIDKFLLIVKYLEFDDIENLFLSFNFQEKEKIELLKHFIYNRFNYLSKYEIENINNIKKYPPTFLNTPIYYLIFYKKLLIFLVEDNLFIDLELRKKLLKHINNFKHNDILKWFFDSFIISKPNILYKNFDFVFNIFANEDNNNSIILSDYKFQLIDKKFIRIYNLNNNLVIGLIKENVLFYLDKNILPYLENIDCFDICYEIYKSGEENTLAYMLLNKN